MTQGTDEIKVTLRVHRSVWIRMKKLVLEREERGEAATLQSLFEDAVDRFITENERRKEGEGRCGR